MSQEFKSAVQSVRSAAYPGNSFNKVALTWTSSMRAEVVSALEREEMTFSEACERYQLSPEELQRGQQASTMMVADRRRAARLPVKEAATALLSSDHQLLCQIADIGPRGARILFASQQRLPSLFDLRCEKTNRVLPVSTVWQRHDSAGVQLLAQKDTEVVENADLGSWLLGLTCRQGYTPYNSTKI